MPAPRFDMDAIKDGLRARLSDMIRDRLPGAVLHGGTWQAGSLNGEKGQSLVIWTRQGGVGAWKDHATGEKGDVLALYAQLYEGTGEVTAEIIARAAGFVGIVADENPDSPESRARREKASADRQRRAARDAAEQAEKREKKRRYWVAQWMGARPCRADDPVWQYLAGRGIDPRHFLDGPRRKLPGAIRFAPEFPFWWTGEKTTHPAMVCQIFGIHPDTGVALQIGTHATALAEVDGQWTKYPVPKPRRIYGGMKGGLIPIWKGGTTTGFPHAPWEAELAIPEGVEDALTTAIACPEMYVGAGCSLTNLAALRSPSPDGFGRVVILADNDWAKPEAGAQVMAARERVLKSGRRCRVVYSEIGKDMNDWLRGEEVA